MEKHKLRRDEILDAAWELFGECGYDAATVTGIIERIGISKGTFYHYFVSKQELLEAGVERVVDSCQQTLETAVDGKSHSALEQLNSLLTASWDWKLANIGTSKWLAPIMLGNRDVVLRHKFDERIALMSANVLTPIITRGVEEAVFDTASPAGTAALIVRQWDYLKSAGTKPLQAVPELEQITTQIAAALEFYLDNVEKLLGVSRGSLQRPTSTYVETIANFYLNWESNPA